MAAALVVVGDWLHCAAGSVTDCVCLLPLLVCLCMCLCICACRARLGLYVFGRQSLFANCFELQPAFSTLLARPTQVGRQ